MPGGGGWVQEEALALGWGRVHVAPESVGLVGLTKGYQGVDQKILHEIRYRLSAHGQQEREKNV